MVNLPDKREQRKLGLHKSHVLAWGLGIVVVLLTVLGSYYYLQNQKRQENAKYAFAINEKKYSKSERQSVYINSIRNNLSTDDFNRKYLELKKLQYVAEKNNIVINKDLLNKKMAEIYPDKKDKTFDQLDIVQQKSIYDNVFIYAAFANTKGQYEGTIFVFPFARHITDYEGHLSAKVADSNKFGIISAYDPAQVEVDKRYAQERAKYYHDGLTNGSINESEALKEIMADKKLANVNSTNESTAFKNDGTVNWQDMIRIEGAIDYIKSLKSPTLSSIQTSKTDVVNNSQKSNVEAQFYFVKLNKAQPAKNGVDFTTLKKQIDEQIKQLKVTIYE